jgi:tetratricopeptide (TPR) repeat protein
MAASGSFLSACRGIGSKFRDGFHLLGNAYGNAGDESRQIEYSRKAFALIDFVSERERLAISAVYHMRVSGDANKASAALELFVQTFPRATIPRAYRGSFYTSMGEFERAANDYEELLRQDSHSRIGYMNLTQTYARLGLFDKARAVAGDAFARKLDAPGLHQILLDIALKQDNQTGAANEIKWFDGRNDEYVSLALQASNAIVRGQRRTASDFLKRAAVGARRNNPRYADVLSEAAAANPFGQCQADEGLPCADVRRKLADLQNAMTERPADTLLSAVHLPARRAAVELQRNRPAKAIELLESAAPFERRYPEVMYLRAVGYLRSGKTVEAMNEFRKIIDHKGSTWGPRYPLAYLGLARAATRAGQTEEARKAYRELFKLWKDPDPDIQELIDVKKEYARLN